MLTRYVPTVDTREMRNSPRRAPRNPPGECPPRMMSPLKIVCRITDEKSPIKIIPRTVFGRIRAAKDLDEALCSLGLEPLSKGFTAAALQREEQRLDP